MFNRLKVLFVALAIFSASINAETLYFLSDNEEISITYTGAKSNPESVSFNINCDSSHCSVNTKTRKVMEDFVIALAFGGIYRYRKDTFDYGACEPDQYCLDPLKLSPSTEKTSLTPKLMNANLMVVNSSRGGKKETDTGLLKDTGRKVKDKLIDKGLDAAWDFLISTDSSGVQTKFLMFRNRNGQLTRLCQITEEGTCDEVSEVIIDDDGNSIGISITDFDYNEAFDRMTQRAIEDFLFNVWSAYKCEIARTGEEGHRTVQIVCWKPH